MIRIGHYDLSHGKSARTSRSALRRSLDIGEATVVENLVYATTQDGLTLKGALIRPVASRNRMAPLLIWVHTRQQGFAEPEYVGVGRHLAALGYPFLTIETRGHDFGAWYRTPDGPTLHGSAWEHFSDCVLDIDAWVAAAEEMGHETVVLIGHGFGGAKCLHFQAQRQLPQVAALVLASSGASVRDKLPPGLEETARAMVAEGRGQDLLPFNTTGQHYASTVSAQYYLARSIMRAELYGSPDVPPAIARIRCPVIGWYGTLEERENRSVHDFLDWLKDNSIMAPATDFAMIEGLDFFYKGAEKLIATHLASRLARVGLAAAPLRRRA
jgi:alpha-beta hydrolase superfamily lysophospholipase